MKIKTAVNRIYWRFGGNENKHPFPVNAEDVEAYTALKDYVKYTQEQQYQQNELFAKLYTYLFMKIMENDKTTILDTEARKKIYSLLKKPLFQVVEDFQASLNESEMYSLYDDLGIDLKHPLERSEEETIQYTNKLNEAVREPETMKRFTGKAWDFETVKDMVEAEVNQAINFFK